MAKPEERIYDGLSQVAHAVRRSTALTVAMHITPPDSSVEALLAQADELAIWLRGSAEEPPKPEPVKPLGEPFRPYSEE